MSLRDNLYDVRIQILAYDKMYNSHHRLGGRKGLILSPDAKRRRGGGSRDTWGVDKGLGTSVSESTVKVGTFRLRASDFLDFGYRKV